MSASAIQELEQEQQLDETSTTPEPEQEPELEPEPEPKSKSPLKRDRARAGRTSAAATATAGAPLSDHPENSGMRAQGFGNLRFPFSMGEKHHQIIENSTRFRFGLRSEQLA